MAYLPSNRDDATLFDFETLKNLGLELAEKYAAGAPFPHVVIDDFLSEDLIDLCIEKFPSTPDPDSQSYDRNQERFKTSYHPDHMEPDLRRLFLRLQFKALHQAH